MSCIISDAPSPAGLRNMARLHVAALSIAAAAAITAATVIPKASSGGVRVALYDGTGATEPGWGNYSVAMALLEQSGDVQAFRLINETQLPQLLNNNDWDVLLVPGGMSTTESYYLGPAGRAAITSFVSAGGGYVGVCAGAYLAGTAECCDRVIDQYYCNGTTGCFKDDWALGMVSMGTANPWARGHGYVNMTLTPEAVRMLDLDPAKYGPGINTTILYWQGPIQDKIYAKNATGWTSLATFTSEIHSGWTNFTTGVMVNTPAIIHAMYGKGRVLLSAPHPEESEPMLLDLIRGYVLWAGGVTN